MAVDLEYYLYEESTGLKTRLGDAFSFGNMFKGGQSRVPLAIYNRGDSLAVNPVAKISEFKLDGKDYSECYKWKKVSLSKTMGYDVQVNLPSIKPETWMTGIDVSFEDFAKYPPDSGAKPDQDWLLWGGGTGDNTWEIYSGYLQHNTDTIAGRACWGSLPVAKDFSFSAKITVRDGVWAGYILRDEGDYDTGYIVLIQGISSYFPEGVNNNEGVIQVWTGKFTSGIDTWKLLYQSGSVGIRATHDPFKVTLTGNRFDFWYKDINSPAPLCSFIDDSNTYTRSSKPILCCHAGNGSTLIYFDDIRMEVETDFGLLWVENAVEASAKVKGIQYTNLEVNCGG